MLFLIFSCNNSVEPHVCYEGLPDVDGNCYLTVQIGEQVWMKENLKVTHYNNGDEIQTGYSNSECSGLGTGAYAVYNDDSSNADIYGNLYNWYAVDDDRGVCPDGFHVPSDEELMELEMFLGMSESEANSIGFRGTDEGSKLAGFVYLWTDGDLENNSEFGTSGFNILPAGYRGTINGGYNRMGINGFFWSSSGIGIMAWDRKLDHSNSDVDRGYYGRPNGFSIRCLGD